jgi:hypothetical protein
MLISEKKLLANRANAQKSTGPVTDSGKTASSMNAVKHGLRAAAIVINSPRLKEDQAEYDLLLASLIEELDPRTPLQEHLVQKIANCLWRSRRIVAAESAQISTQLDSIRPDRLFVPGYGRVYENDPDNILGVKEPVPPEIKTRAVANLIGVNSIPDDSFNSNFLIYEMRLDRQLTRTLRLLKQLKCGRKSRRAKKIEEKSQKKESFKSVQSNPTPSAQNPPPIAPPTTPHDKILTG